MGNARFSNVDWNAHAARSDPLAREDIFRSTSMPDGMDPATITKREAVASAANPRPTPIILGADQTGSMGELAERIIKRDLGVIMKALYDRKPVSDPQILCAAIGDAHTDVAPLQVTQFEASIVLADQVAKLWLEGNGGGNGGESYSLVWAFAAYKTRCDAIRKEGRKGYLFTIGDECPHDEITREQVKRFLGLDGEAGLRTDALLADVQKDWNVFHLIVKPVSNQPVVEKWKKLLGERAIVVQDLEHLAEGIVACIQVLEGQDPHVGTSGESAVAVRSVTDQLVAKS